MTPTGIMGEPVSRAGLICLTTGTVITLHQGTRMLHHPGTSTEVGTMVPVLLPGGCPPAVRVKGNPFVFVLCVNQLFGGEKLYV